MMGIADRGGMPEQTLEVFCALVGCVLPGMTSGMVDMRRLIPDKAEQWTLFERELDLLRSWGLVVNWRKSSTGDLPHWRHSYSYSISPDGVPNVPTAAEEEARLASIEEAKRDPRKDPRPDDELRRWADDAWHQVVVVGLERHETVDGKPLQGRDRVTYREDDTERSVFVESYRIRMKSAEIRSRRGVAA